MTNFRLFLMGMLTCIGLTLSGCWASDVESHSIHKLIGYSGDSLEVSINRQTEETCLQKPLGADCSIREKGSYIVVENFYTQEEVWRSSKIRDKYVANIYDLVNDSTILEYDRSDASFYKWTLGKGDEKLGKFTWSGCDMSQNVSAIRNWGEGKLRLIGKYTTCAYAIVDLEKRTITGYENMEEFAEGCSDLWDHEGIKYCVGTMYQRILDGIYLKNEYEIKDSLWGNQISEGVNYSIPLISYKNSYLWIMTGCCDTHLLKIDYEKEKLYYVREE